MVRQLHLGDQLHTGWVTVILCLIRCLTRFLNNYWKIMVV